jgi:hypothetical protein
MANDAKNAQLGRKLEAKTSKKDWNWSKLDQTGANWSGYNELELELEFFLL